MEEFIILLVLMSTSCAPIGLVRCDAVIDHSDPDYIQCLHRKHFQDYDSRRGQQR